MDSPHQAALVLLSGGQDSTTCLFWARREFASVETVSFDYGQRHRIELEAAALIAKRAGVPNRILRLGGFSEIGGNALVDDIAIGGLPENGLPNTFVPGRNVIFLAYAAACAYDRGIRDLVAGVCQTDYSGYPDCRQTSIDATARAISLGMDSDFRIHTPLMHLTKAQSIGLARKVGAIEALAYTHTCYRGVYPPCGECPACLLRAKGFQEAGIEDPLIVRSRLRN
jgi:7-cyano-7-deazaguanine synthase